MACGVQGLGLRVKDQGLAFGDYRIRIQFLGF